MEKRNPDQIPNDIAALKGMRFVHASESGEGQRLDEEFIKDATGRDTLAARFMHGEWFNFQSQFKLWLRTNHKPVGLCTATPRVAIETLTYYSHTAYARGHP